jgi:2'-5' RNA ligase
MQKRHRIFIAINLPEKIKKELADFQNKWPELPARWTSLDNIHITLEFLGYLTDQELADVCKITKEVVKRHNSFSINLNKICYGPADKIPPRMIWVSGEKSKELFELKNDLEKSLLESVRFAPEKREFAPHITLARIRQWDWRKIEPEERPDINEDIDFSFFVDSIEIMESNLRRGGAEYSILESHQLGQ